MYIKNIRIENFGKFQNKSLDFAPGINIVYGENESGKSTLHSFLVGMLFGIERQRGRSVKNDTYQRYTPWNTASYFAGSMNFQVDGKEFALWRNFYHKERSARLYNCQDGEELSVEHGDLQVLLGGINRKFYENTYCVPQAAVVTEEKFATELQQEMVNRVYGGDTGIDVGRAQKTLENKYKQQEQKLKKQQQETKERRERLQWEQELLMSDIGQLQQKLLDIKENIAEEVQAENPAADTKNATEQSFREEKDAPDCFWFRIPLLGWILKMFWRIRKKKRVSKAGGEVAKGQWYFKEKEIPKENITATDKVLGATEILRQQLEEKQMRLSNLQEELEELQHTTGQQRELQTELKSIGLARQVIERVAEEVYQDHSDELQATISQIFSGITRGKYDQLEITGDGNVFLYEKETQRFPWQLSRGTMEQLYFALRLGAGRCMLQEEPMPLMLDETFCAYDDQRLKQTLQWLSCQKEQVILFTCQKRELSLLEEMGIAYHRIFLES